MEQVLGKLKRHGMSHSIIEMKLLVSERFFLIHAHLLTSCRRLFPSCL